MSATVNPEKEVEIYRPIKTSQSMQRHLQWAVTLEFFTVSAYLVSCYSIKDRGSTAYQLIRSVVFEEMLHVYLVSNIMNAIGSSPKFTNAHCPDYPTFIPHVAEGGPYVQLQAATVEQMQQVFMAIENLAPVEAPAEGNHFQTIGQFYKAISIGFEKYSTEEWFKNPVGKQRTDYYFGGGAGKVIAVTDKASALLAIDEIVKQGEGASNIHAPLVPFENWGSYENYGKRTDNTYGPILGSSRELSHYYKFKVLADGIVPITDTYPMLPNPSPDKFTNQQAAKAAEVFNYSYSAMLYAMEQSFSSDKKENPFFTVACPIMQSILSPLGVQLMTMPTDSNGDSSNGPNAGPPFQWENGKGKNKENELLREAAQNAEEFIEKYQEAAYGNSTLNTSVNIMKSVLETLNDIRSKAQCWFL